MSVHEAAKADLALGPAHKEVARALLEALAAEDATDASPLAAVAAKSAALVERLSSWFSKGVDPSDTAAFFAVTRERGVPRSAEGFLFGLATAEPRLRRIG